MSHFPAPMNATVEPDVAEDVKTRRQPPYNVVLIDDDEHTYEYVIRMLRDVFGYTKEKGMQLAREVDFTGRAILLTTTLEHAELKRDQIHAYGKDWRIAECSGSMTAVVEPVH